MELLLQDYLKNNKQVEQKVKQEVAFSLFLNVINWKWFETKKVKILKSRKTQKSEIKGEVFIFN